MRERYAGTGVVLQAICLWCCVRSGFGARFLEGQSFASSSLLINLVCGGGLFSEKATQSCPI